MADHGAEHHAENAEAHNDQPTSHDAAQPSDSSPSPPFNGADDSTSIRTEQGPASDAPSQLEDVSRDSPEDLRVRRLLEHSIDLAAFTPAVEALEPADAADALEELEVEDAADVVYAMEDMAAAQNLAEMERPLAVTVLEDLTEEHGPREPAKYIGLMDLDDAVDMLQAMPEDMRRSILAELPAVQASRLRMLLVYDPESAGGVMTPDCVVVNDDAVKRDAIAQIRNIAWWSYNRFFVVDNEGRLVGDVRMRDLILAPRGERIENIMGRDIDVLRADLDREEIAAAFERYDYTVMPVVNDENRLLGVVTVDDVLDIIQEEHTEDSYLMVGAGKSEAIYSSLTEKFKGRIPWLMVNLFTSFVAAVVVFQFDELIGKITALAVLMPVIANQAGNAGQQSLAVTLRGLILREVRTKRIWPLIWRELLLGALTGLIVGCSVGTIIGIMGEFGLQDASWRLGMIVATAMTGSLAVGCLAGTLVPLIMERLKRDPATASTIFLTMVTDSMSFLTFLGLARMLM